MVVPADGAGGAITAVVVLATGAGVLLGVSLVVVDDWVVSAVEVSVELDSVVLVSEVDVSAVDDSVVVEVAMVPNPGTVTVPVVGVAVGAWGWPSVIWLTGAAVVVEVLGLAGEELEIPNWEVYWYAPVASSMSWMP